MSKFIKHADDYTADEINFDDIIKLPAGGSTCDIYRTRWQRRNVFIKRLKEEFRYKPIHLDALDKEFEIGTRLHHPSLPEYREFHHDFIVMDYIDGMTLEEMIRGNDPWLTSERNVVRMLHELVEVVDYLHRHNVVHCDIKPDNIMITSNNKNLVLVDFDKSYTDAMSDTSGDPGKYGFTSANVGSVNLDFHGIGMVAERLKNDVEGFKFSQYNKFIKSCYDPDSNCEELLAILDSTPKPHKALLITLLIVIAIGLSGAYFFLFRQPQKEATAAEPAVETPADTAAHALTAPLPTAEPAAEAPADPHARAQAIAAFLDRRIQPSFAKLMEDLDRLQGMKNDASLSGQALLDAVRRHGDMADEYIIEAHEILKESYPGLTERETARIMSYSKAYTGYTRRATPELREFGHEIERRFRAEGREIQ